VSDPYSVNSVRITQLTAGYERTPVLDDVSLTVAAGSTTAILGSSGSGKTTLLRSVAGFLRPSSGRIEIGDLVVSDADTFVPPQRRAVGYVRQDGALFPHLDVASNLTFGLTRAARRRPGVVEELLELVGLSAELARRRPDQLSGGQQQRVALARALAREPTVVLLDEPFSSLDAGLRARTREATAAALAERKATTLLVTHDQAEALSFADQVAIVRDGRLVQVGPPAQVYRAPADPELAQFLGEAVVLPARAQGKLAHCSLGTVHLARPAQGSVHIVLRPEQIKLTGVVAGAAPQAGTVPATVRRVDYYGHDALVDLDLPGVSEPVLARLAGAPLPAPGSSVTVHVDGEANAFAAPGV
jgi:iron(III) transport system ATP-binding protein